MGVVGAFGGEADVTSSGGFFFYGMQMNAYDINNLLLMIQKADVQNFYTEFTHSEDEFGLMIYFKKPDNS